MSHDPRPYLTTQGATFRDVHSPTHAWWCILPDGVQVWAHRHDGHLVVLHRDHDGARGHAVRLHGPAEDVAGLVERVRAGVVAIDGGA